MTDETTAQGRVPSIHVIGNIQLDVLAAPVTALPPAGGDTIIDRIDVRPAGAAGNVSLALAALATPHRLFGSLGDDYAGRWVLRELRRLGLDSGVRIVPGTATGISIALEAPRQERAFLTAHGVLDSWSADALPADATEADFVLLTGYFSLPGMRGDGTRDLLVRARGNGATTLLDTGWDPDDWRTSGVREIHDLLPLVDLFLPNEPEALALTGEPDAAAAAAALAEMSGGRVIVKLGERGAIAHLPGGGLLAVSAPATTPLDTTGAGDSFAAGLITALAESGHMNDALRLGVAVASTVVARPSHDRYPSRQELDPRL
ncbi:carbohydrate kinase family protein [Actinomadura sp. HBU206391]|uniref:carbohydrate kinase family protein n=1 Tax=Actinomadura sp. HBU206391 TaxID=2731692 RepID=UPI0016508C97|nr:carbohydrate kinase family protein [Actinomadura sp. HBU206391]MBC6458364.1 carbohydrate kinase family protein [Actinomadura sp. HBU206391]